MARATTSASTETACPIWSGDTVTKLDRCRQQRHRVTAFWQGDPEEHAALRHHPVAAVGQMGFERHLHGIAALPVARAHGGHMGIEKAVAHHLVNHALVVARRVQVGGLFGLQQFGVNRRGRHEVAEAQPGRQHLRERAEVDRAVRPPRRQGCRGRCIEPQLTVGVVFHQRQADRLG